MAARTDPYDELTAAWRALANSGDDDGWRLIPVAPDGPCRFLAGRRFPGNEESLLIGFATAQLPAAITLPQGRGFKVDKVSLAGREANHAWIALSRKKGRSIELFTMMATDVITTMMRHNQSGDVRAFNLFLTRIRAWQDFMQRNPDDVLSAEAEVGLFGELHLLQSLVLNGLPPHDAVEGWHGPLDGLHDFLFGTGGVEVKSTVASGSFPAQIGSLEQLDDSLVQPLFLAGVRLELSPEGETLMERAAAIQALFADDPIVQSILDGKLLRAGLLPSTEEKYTRKFRHLGTRILRVAAGFPRLTGRSVPNEIRKVRYEIDLDLISAHTVDLRHAMKELGLI